MGAYILDLSIIAILVIGITALNGVVTNRIGISLFGGKEKNRFVDKSTSIQTGWKTVGGEKK
ncbi:hypothetical protein WQ57_16430 [Mesobacillus campisalis]|uniref:Uncharacterized protein n=1 Tax=Mesobacillus campisalis TaxID=1408103 RepID=A0A0M2SWH1_9BACI|nr:MULTISPECIES: hypothetical protein [Bacillaceae]KKK36970.1 hypothetical protein WQ57_16430 [Mesobacillus campisalis]